MPRISTYQTVTPQGDDTIIISQANGSPADATKNITVNSLTNLVQEEAGMLYIDTEISSAQILDLQNTPVVLVPAQGAGTVVSIGRMFAKYTFGTTAYSQNGNVFISINVNYIEGVTAGQGFFNLDTSQDMYQLSPADYRVGQTPSAIENKDVVIQSPSPITLGDGTIKVRTYYSVIPSTF